MRQKIIRKLLLVFTLCLLSPLPGKDRGSITGTIKSNKTGQPLAGANILLQNTYIGTASANNGSFIIDGIDEGEYSLVVTMMGYRRFITPPILVTGEDTPNIIVTMVEDVLSSPQVVVTATRKVQDIMESPVSVTVLGPRQIISKAAVSLEEVLPYQAGITIVKDQINIRGANSYSLGAGNRSLLLLDGLPLLGSAGGNITWAVVPTSEIARVEIVKSSGSAQYGSSAMGGVINIITRNTPALPETRLRVKGGFYSEPKYEQWQWRDGPGLFHNLEITHARPFGQHGFWLRLQQRQTDSYYRLGWKDAVNLTGKLKLNFGSRYSASLFANVLSDQSGISSLWKNAGSPFEAPRGYADDRFTGTKLNLSGSFSFIYSPDAVMKLRSSFYGNSWHNDGLTNNDFSDERKYYSEGQVSTNWGPTLSTTAGVVAQRATIDAKIFGNHSSYSGAVYLLAQKRLSRSVSISTGGRYESYSVDGNLIDRTFSPQIAANYNPNEALAFRASVGHGFRVPTVAEMFSRSSLSVFSVVPNPDLVAENSISSEVGATVILPGNGIVSGLKLDASLFSNVYSQMIEPVIFGPGAVHFENITDARIRGAEISLSGSILNNFITSNLSYTWIDPVELDSGGSILDTLSYRYRSSFNWQSAVNWKRLTFAVDYRYNSRMEKVELFQENAGTGADRRVPIHLCNLGFSYRAERLEVQFRIENLLQYYFVDLERNMGPERSLSISLALLM